jgi:segregation and condensation protein B
MRLLKQQIEALIFTADAGIDMEEIQSCLKTVYGWELTKEEVAEKYFTAAGKYKSEDFSFELVEIAGGFEFLTKKDFHVAIHTLLQIKEKKKLSTAALETLSIIRLQAACFKT